MHDYVGKCGWKTGLEVKDVGLGLKPAAQAGGSAQGGAAEGDPLYAAGAPLNILCTSISHLPLDISSSISERSSSLLC